MHEKHLAAGLCPYVLGRVTRLRSTGPLEVIKGKGRESGRKNEGKGKERKGRRSRKKEGKGRGGSRVPPLPIL